MLSRLRVKNYRSLRNVDVTLGSSQCLVGPDAEGRGAFLDVLEFDGETRLRTA